MITKTKQHDNKMIAESKILSTTNLMEGKKMTTLYRAKQDQDEGVFKCPNVVDKNLVGYKEVERYFVDNSGFGADNEPALTASQFIRKVKSGRYYGIVEEGQFQVYIGEFEKEKRSKKELLKELGLISRKKVANNTWEVTYSNGDRAIQLHATDIITFREDQIILNSGGWCTQTTKKRINQHLPYSWRLFQEKGNWYLQNSNWVAPKHKIEFYDNIKIDAVYGPEDFPKARDC